jgi:endonuclease/exonuclease/phosphatase family metal-dependent hydrolase
MRRPWIPIALAALVAALPPPAHALRVVTYNILNFPGTDGATRVDDFRLVLDAVDPDVVIVQEMISSAGVTQFLNDVMNYTVAGEYAAGPFVNGPDTDNALFYKNATVTYISHQEIATALRNISEYVLRPVGYSSTAAQFRMYSGHLKAGETSSDQTARLAEATILRNYLNGLPAGSHFAFGADMNVQSSTETAYQKLVGSETDNDGRLKDPLNQPGTWHDNGAFASIHSQSPRTTQFGGGATGGMDDRFDQLLVSYAFDDGSGLSVVPGTYTAYGNDGLHFNQAINAGTNEAVGTVIANALHAAADHIPVFFDFQVPAKIGAGTSLALGDVIVGGVKALPLGVENQAVAPADELTYSLAVPSGFTGPSGPFELAAGGSAEHSIGLDSTTAGVKNGTLVISSNDVDYSTWNVGLSGTVLRHARPSLDGSAVVLSDTIDFGSHPAAEFTEQALLVFNVGYDSLQALLEANAATITGGGGRFSFVGGFTPAEIGGVRAEYALAFDAVGATEDSLYTASLLVTTRDDWEKTGATVLDTLRVALQAFVQGGTSVPGGGELTFSIGRCSPNPFTGGTSLALTLPRDTDVSVSVYDVAGRRVRALVSGTLTRGIHEIAWDGRDRAGAKVSTGVYFYRVTAGEVEQLRTAVLLR